MSGWEADGYNTFVNHLFLQIYTKLVSFRYRP